MKLIVPLLALLLSSSCKKKQADTPLSGTWKLIEIVDKSTNSSQFAPVGNNHIEITFNANGSFSGKTLKNSIWDGSYTLTGYNDLNFGTFSMTKIAEDDLGSNFLEVLMSCLLQSIAPCKPSAYQITAGKLYVNSALRYNLVMEKK